MEEKTGKDTWKAVAEEGMFSATAFIVQKIR